MLSILIVDDEPSIRLAMGDALMRAGYTVMRANDGRQALVLCDQQTFDLIVSDIHMPHVDGIALLRRIRVAYPRTDVLLMTAYSKVDEVVSAFKLGADDYLTKPFTTDDLIERVRTIEVRRADLWA